MSAKKRFKMWPLPGLIVVLMIGSFAHDATGQGGPETLRELRRTDTVLLTGKRLVIDENCPSKLARELLIQARDIQKEAWGSYDRGHYGQALKGTKVARTRAQEAIKIAERWQFVVKQIRKTRELLELAQELAAASHNSRAPALLETALSQFERGTEALRGGQIDQAFHLMKNANKLARDIIAMLREEQADGERVYRELDRTDRLIEKAGPVIEESGDDHALVLLDQGVQAQVKAREFYQKGQYGVAHQVTLKARDLVAKALVRVEGPISPQRVEKAIAAMDDLMARVRSLIMESENDRAIDLFLAAGDHQDKAKAALSEKQYQLALAQTKIARRLVDQALNLLSEA
jgi:hypothetical protein